ncbi:MAG: ATP-binding protein [Lentisphaeria bacterium]
MHSKNFNKISKLATKAVSDYKMIEANDRLLIGLSGGNDSMLLMHLLANMQKRAPFNFEIHAVTVDAGFDGIDLSKLIEYCAENNWPHHIIKINGKKLIEEKNASDRPCALCSRMRRGKIHGFADEFGFSKIVLGQHLDDICVSFLMSLFHGQGLTTMGPKVKADRANGCNKQIIRPLAYVPKALIDQCCLEDFEFPTTGECDYSQWLSENGDRAFLMKKLSELEIDFPHIRQNMLKSLTNVQLDYLLDRQYLEL